MVIEAMLLISLLIQVYVRPFHSTVENIVEHLSVCTLLITFSWTRLDLAVGSDASVLPTGVLVANGSMIAIFVLALIEKKTRSLWTRAISYCRRARRL